MNEYTKYHCGCLCTEFEGKNTNIHVEDVQSYKPHVAELTNNVHVAGAVFNEQSGHNTQ